MSEPLSILIQRWKADPHSTYSTWFLWEERLKNFRSIRRGISQVVREIEDGSFGNAYRGSSLETVVYSIAEQRQMFKGADHAFIWKPKLRIPDIYENRENQLAFGHLLHTCHCGDTQQQIVAAIRRIDAHAIKGLGPAVANLLYFLHPTLVSPFNTAIVKGYNAIIGGNVKLGRWDHYLAMREGILALNTSHRALLSNDLGAIAGLLFDVGSGRYPAPPLTDDPTKTRNWEEDLARVREETAAQRKAFAHETASDETHTEVQGWLRDLGRALGYAVWVAANDRRRPYAHSHLGEGCLDELPSSIAAASAIDAIRLIDLIWLDPQTQQVAAAFEVEHSTSIYSGIIRMLDLALGTDFQAQGKLFLVAPDEREKDVTQQLQRPAFSRVRELGIRYLPYGELRANRETIAKFGTGLKPILAIAKSL